MKNEPEIVRILRAEERAGKIHGKLHGGYEKLRISRESLNETLNKISHTCKDDVKRTNKNIELGRIKDIYRTIFENSAVAITLTDKNERIVSWNKYAENLLGMNKKDLYLKPIRSLYPSEEWQKIRSQNVRQKGMQHHLETKILRKNNKSVDVDISLSVLKNSKGKIIGSIGVIKDISEQKKMKKVLEESEEKFKQLYEKAPVLYHMLSPDGVITNVNEKWCKTFRYAKREVLGKSIFDFVVEDERELAESSFKEKLQSKKAYTGGHERKYVTKDGKERILIINDFFAFDKDNNVTSVHTTMEDLTERKKMEGALHESEEKFRMLAEQNLMGITILQNDIVKYINPATSDIIGYSAKEMNNWKQKEFARAIHPKDLPFVMEQAKKKQMGDVKNVTDRYSYRIITKNQEIKWVDQHSKSIIYEGRPADFITLIDITDRKKAEEELKKASELLHVVNQELERKVKERTSEIKNLLKQKDEFISQLGHDLKTPLSVIMNVLPMIQDEAKKPNVKEDCKVAIRNVDYIKNLVTETLKIAELSSPNTKFDMKETNLLEIVDNAIIDNQLVLDKKNIKIENMIDEKITVRADDLRIKEVFNNLITNAVRYTPDDQGIIAIDAKKDRDYVTISVRDTGIGLTEEKLGHIFDEFYKADESRHDLGGSGLGLSICKRIIEKHGGKIWVESPGPRMGSTFYFTLHSKKLNEE